jgi:hypothetical protein
VVIVVDRDGVVEALVVAEDVAPGARVEPLALAWAVRRVVAAEGGLAGLENSRRRIVLDLSDGRYSLFPSF